MQRYQTPFHLWRNPSSGVWYLVWQEAGKPVRRSTRTKSKAEAEAILRQAVSTAQTGHAARISMTLHAALDDWSADRHHPRRCLAESTLSHYRTLVRQVKSVASPRLLVADLERSPRDVRLLLERVEHAFDLSPETMKLRHSYLSSVFRWLVREGVLLTNPVDRVEPPAAMNRHKPATTEEEYAGLVDELDAAIGAAPKAVSRRTLQTLRDLVEVLWLSGLRSIEGCRLLWEDIDLEQRLWTIRSPRNKGGITTRPIHERLVPVLRRRQLLGLDGPFPSLEGVRCSWRRFREKSEQFRHADFHSLRHGFVTRMRRLGFDAAAQHLARHKSAVMTDHYTHFGPEEFRDQLNQL